MLTLESRPAYGHVLERREKEERAGGGGGWVAHGQAGQGEGYSQDLAPWLDPNLVGPNLGRLELCQQFYQYSTK